MQEPATLTSNPRFRGAAHSEPDGNAPGFRSEKTRRPESLKEQCINCCALILCFALILAFPGGFNSVRRRRPGLIGRCDCGAEDNSQRTRRLNPASGRSAHLSVGLLLCLPVLAIECINTRGIKSYVSLEQTTRALPAPGPDLRPEEGSTGFDPTLTCSTRVLKLPL